MTLLEGKIAVVTGGSRGLGRAVIERFLEDGAQVVTGSRTPPVEPFQGEVKWYELDVSDRASVEELIQNTFQSHGRIDILVNNAGIEIEKTIEQSNDQDWDQVAGINMKGVYLCTQATLPIMRSNGGGSIINISSISSFVADPNLALYNASKAWVSGFTRSVAVDHGRDGIRCNAVCPGWIMTDMLMQTFAQASDVEAAMQAAIAKHPLGRLGEPRDIANTVAWLASDQSSFVSGQTITVDGGLTAAAPIDPSDHG